MVQLYHIVEIDLTFDILLHYTGISAVYLISVLGKHYRHYINQHKAFWKHQCRRLCGQCHMRAEDEKEFFISPFDNSCAMYWKGVKFSQVAASRLRRQWRWKYASRTMALTNDTVDKRKSQSSSGHNLSVDSCIELLDVFLQKEGEQLLSSVFEPMHHHPQNTFSPTPITPPIATPRTQRYHTRPSSSYRYSGTRRRKKVSISPTPDKNTYYSKLIDWTEFSPPRLHKNNTSIYQRFNHVVSERRGALDVADDDVSSCNGGDKGNTPDDGHVAMFSNTHVDSPGSTSTARPAVLTSRIGNVPTSSHPTAGLPKISLTELNQNLVDLEVAVGNHPMLYNKDVRLFATVIFPKEQEGGDLTSSRTIIAAVCFSGYSSNVAKVSAISRRHFHMDIDKLFWKNDHFSSFSLFVALFIHSCKSLFHRIEYCWDIMCRFCTYCVHYCFCPSLLDDNNASDGEE